MIAPTRYHTNPFCSFLDTSGKAHWKEYTTVRYIMNTVPIIARTMNATFDCSLKDCNDAAAAAMRSPVVSQKLGRKVRVMGLREVWKCNASSKIEIA